MRHLMTGRFLSGLILAGVGIGILAGGALATLQASSEGHPATGVITEDMPGWDCATMGNRVCGSDRDLTDPFERCLSAVEAAHIPGWMWECHQTPPPVIVG